MSTTKILIGIGIITGILISVGVYFRLSQPGKEGEVVTAKSEASLTTEPLTDLAKYDFIRESLIRALEASMSAVNKRIDDLSKKQTTTSTGVPPLTTATIVTSSAPAATTTPTVKTMYIPMGYGGSSVATTDFESIGATEIAINPSDYPGYKQMVFEANLRIFQGNGQGSARIYNKTDGTAVLNSLVSTTSQDYATKTSSGFTLTGGSKTYVVQLKSTTGYSVDLQLTRLRIDF